MEAKGRKEGEGERVRKRGGDSDMCERKALR